MSARGVVRAGYIEITEGALPPEGTTVDVEIRMAAVVPADRTLPGFAMWRERVDLGDSRDYVERLREAQWHP